MKLLLARKFTVSAALSVSAVALLAFAAQAVRADSLSTPFNLELSSQSAQTLLSGIQQFKSPTGEFTADLPDQSLTTPYAVSISGIHLTVDYTFNTPTATTGLNQWTIQSSSIHAEMIVDSINASQTVVEQSGGSTLTLQVNAVCTDVHLQLAPGSTQMSATVNLALSGGIPSFTMSNFYATWTPQVWQITSMNCQGPNGFYQLVEQDVSTQLQSINPFLPAIETQIQAQIAAVDAAPISWTVQDPGLSGVSITLEPANLSFQSGGEVSLAGVASFNFSKLQNTSCQTQIATAAAPALSTDSLVVPISAVEKLVQCAYMNGSVQANFTSAQFPAFQSLLGNWFLKLFVWPDLERFNSSSVFQFDLYPTAEPTFGAMSSNSSGEFLFNLAVPLTMSINSPQAGGYAHYLDFSTQISGSATLSVKNGVVTFLENSSQLSLATFWDLLYVQTYSPDEDVWTSQIASDIKSFLAKTGISYTLPVWQAPGSFSMTIEDAVVDGANVSISLGITPLSSASE